MNIDEAVEIIGGRELSRRLGVSETTIRKARDNGRIQSYYAATGKYIWPAAAEEFSVNRDPAKMRENTPELNFLQPEEADAKGESRRGSRERMDKAKADLAEMELARKRGELVPVSSVERQARKVAVMVKQQLMAIPDRISADLAVDTDQNSIKIKLDMEFRKVLEAMSSEAGHLR